MADETNILDSVTGSWGDGAGHGAENYSMWNPGNYYTPGQNQYDMVQEAANEQAKNIISPGNSDVGSPSGLLAGIKSQNDANLAATPIPNLGTASSPSNNFGGLTSVSNAVTMGGSNLGAVGAVAGGIGTIAGAYEGASTDTGSSVLSGVASGASTGAAIGSIVPGVGTVFGAVAGGIIGGLAGLFGSKSKKKEAKQKFQEQEQLAVLPQQQEQANYLQKQGLLQKAISNYSSGYTPGGYQYKNKMFGNQGAPTYAMPSNNPSLPNFNVAPPNVVPGGGNNSLGIMPQNTPNNGVNLNPIHGASGLVAPNSTIQQPPQITAQAPGYTGNTAQDQQNLSTYQQQYLAMLNQENQKSAAAAMNPYVAYYHG